MMKTKIVFLCFLAILLSGCYNYKEINDLIITSALGIDKNENGYKVVAQVINTQKSGNMESSNTNAASFVVFTSEGKTLQSSYENIINEAGKKLYINHLSLLVINEDVAKYGISNILDLFSRDYNFRKQVLVIISKDSAEKTLSNVTPLIPSNSDSIKEILINNEKYIGTTYAFELEDLLKIYLNKKKELVIPTFVLENSDSKSDNSDELKETNIESKLKFFSNAIFKEDKLIGYLSERESLGYNIIMGNIKSTLIDVKCDDKNYAVLELTNSKTDFKNKKGTLEFNIKFTANAILSELNCNIDIEKYKILNKLEKKLNVEVKNIINDSIKNAMTNLNTDIFGFRDLIYKNNPDFYKTIEDKLYKNEYDNLKINIQTDIIITSHGNLIRSVDENE